MSTDHEAHVPTPDLPLTAPLPTLGERLSEGDADALAALFEREASSIYHFALGYLRSEASAEDIVQTVFIRAWERHGDLRDPDRVRAWLFSIARNLVRDQLRAPSLDSVDDHFALPAPGRAPEDEAAAREERELVWTAAQSLEPRQALVLDLAVRQQFTSSEIGEALGYRPGHAAVLVSRAKQALAGAVTSLLIARRVGRCERLALLVPESPVALSPEERRTVDHHMRRCPVCQHNAGLVTSPAELFSLIPLAVLSGETAQQLWHRAAQSTGSLRLTAAQPPCPPSPTGRNATPPSTSPPRAGQPPTVAQGRQQMNATPPPRGYPLSHLPRWVLATGLAALGAAVVGGTVVVIHGSQPAPSSRSAAAQPPGTCAEIPERVLAAIGGGTGDLRVCITHSLDNGLVSAFYLTLHSTSGGVGIAAGDFVAVGADHSIELQSSAGFGCWNSALHFLPNDTVSPTTPLCIQDGASAVNEELTSGLVEIAAEDPAKLGTRTA